MKNNENISATASGYYMYNNGTGMEPVKCLSLTWAPLESITIYELALCIPFLHKLDSIMPFEFDEDAIYAKHFKNNQLN